MSKQRLKIAFVSDAVLPFHKGGKETRIYHFSRELTRMNQEVHVYTMQWWDGGKTYRHNGITYHALCRQYPLYTGDRRSIKEGVMFGLACFKMLRYNFDIIETDHMPYFPLFSTKFVSLIKRKPLYATWHEVVGLQAWREYMGTVSGTIAYIIERLSVKLPNHILAASDHTKKQLRSVLKYKGQLSLVNNGIDYRRIKPISPAKMTSDIMYAGRLVPHKNVDLLIKAVATLRTDRPDIRCLIVGTGPEHARLQALVTRLGLENNVTMTGRLESSDDVYALMKTSKVFASPSIREGFGITVLEAFACGLSVVTVNHRDNAAQYLVNEGSGIVCEPNAEAIAEAIDTLLTDETTAPQAINSEAFDWSHRSNALKEAYGL